MNNKAREKANFKRETIFKINHTCIQSVFYI